MAENNEIDLTSISIEAAAKMLAKLSGRKITQERIQHHIETRNAPVNEDGTINVFEYAAWMCKELNA
jgi:hypothetical protein